MQDEGKDHEVRHHGCESASPGDPDAAGQQLMRCWCVVQSLIIIWRDVQGSGIDRNNPGVFSRRFPPAPTTLLYRLSEVSLASKEKLV